MTSSPASRGGWRKILLAGHVAAAVGLIGAAAALAGLGVSGLRGAQPISVFPPAHLVDAWVVVPLALLTLATGIVQAVLGPWRLTTDRWVTIKLVSTALATLVVSFVLLPSLARSAQGALAGESFGTGAFLPLAIAPSVAVLLLVVNVALGLFKPTSSRSARIAKAPR